MHLTAIYIYILFVFVHYFFYLQIWYIPHNKRSIKEYNRSSTLFFRSSQQCPSYNVNTIKRINKQTSKLSSAISLVYRGRLEIFPFIEIFSPLPSDQSRVKTRQSSSRVHGLKERKCFPVQRVGKKLDLANTASKGLAKRPIKSSPPLLIRRSAAQIFG